MTGLYIHIPFCVQKCIYCDFVSFAGCESSISDYITSLEHEAKRYKGEKIDTVFIGGGTPSILSADEINRLMCIINENFIISPCAEFTAEVNPESVTDEKIRAFTRGGVNRISMGVQSFCDSELKTLGRVHSSHTAKSAAMIIGKYVDNFNIDIMTGIPSQTVDSLLDTLKTAISLSPTHLSCYSLIIEEGTPLYNMYKSGTVQVPDEDTDREMYRITGEFLESNGYLRYEISNYAKEGFSCRHNINYWDCGEYIGLGAGAHSYRNSERYYNSENISEYINNPVKITAEVLVEADKMSEFMIMGLRKTKGVSKSDFSARFNKPLEDVFGETVKKYKKLGFLEETGDFLRFTLKGIDVSNSILCEFI